MDVERLNFADPKTYQDNDMPSVWGFMRDEHPVYWHAPRDGHPGFWMLSRHSDAVEVYRDGQRFSSERGNVLASLLDGHDTGAGRMLAVTDGRRHRELRGVLSKAFSPRVLRLVAERIEQYSRALLREVAGQGSCDIAREVAEHIPLNTICDLLGVPDADRPFLLRANQSALSSIDPDQTDLEARMARNEILMYFCDLARSARRNPRENVVSALASHQVDGEYLDDDDIALNCYSLILGGDETSRLAIISAVLELATNAPAYDALRSGGVDLTRATEEVLRWTTPAMHFGRRALEDVFMDGYLIRAGEIVTIWNSAANRDPDVFPNPERFYLDRADNRHLAFGFGPHFCIGAYLARAEIRAVLGAIRTLPGRIEIAAEPRRIHSNFLNGFSSLQVTFVPA